MARPEKAPNGEQHNGKGPESSKSRTFSSAEASRLLQERWNNTVNDHNDSNVVGEEKPVLYTSGEVKSGWGASNKLHLQAGIGDFCSEVISSIKKLQQPSAAGK